MEKNHRLELNFFHFKTETRFHFNMFLWIYLHVDHFNCTSTLDNCHHIFFFFLYLSLSNGMCLSVAFSLVHRWNGVAIWRNSHKDYMRWSFKRAATTSTFIRGNFSISACSIVHIVQSVDKRISLLQNYINIYSKTILCKHVFTHIEHTSSGTQWNCGVHSVCLFFFHYFFIYFLFCLKIDK